MTVRQFGPYELEELIGVGGMGEVWRARDTRRERLVALKVLPESLAHDHEFLSRFRRESHVAARLREPHVVPIHDYGEIDGRLYIDMRLVDGRDLGEILRDGPLAPERAVALLAQAADALEAAHADGLVHRDVKPSNILVTPNDFVYVVDFGIARSVGSTQTSLTITGATVGTLDYMAPERFTNTPIDGRVDVYSLACVLAECLTATRPFAGSDLPALLYAHLYSDPPRPSELVSGVPRQLDAVISRGMAKRADDRYSTPCELIGSAKAALQDAAAPAGPAAVPTAATASGAAAAAATVPREPETVRSVDEPVAAAAATGTDGVAPVVPRQGPLPPLPAVDLGLRSADGGHRSTEPLAPSSAGPRGPVPPAHGAHGAHGGPGAPRGPAGKRRQRWPVLVGVLVLALVAVTLTVLLWQRDSDTGSGTAQPGTSAPPTDGTATGEPPSPSPIPTPEPPAASLAVPYVEGDPIEVNPTPGYMAVAPNGRFAYIANRDEGIVTVFDTTLGKATGTIPIPAGPPWFITFSPDSRVAYITVTNAPEYTENRVVFVDTRVNRVMATVEVGLRPYAPETSPDGRLLYVPLHDEGRVQVLDTTTAQEIASYAVARNPHWIAVSADGRTGYTANHESNLVSVLDLTAGGRVITTVPVGTSPHSIAVSPDGSQVSVVCFDSNDVWIIDPATHAVVTTIPIGTRPQDITYAPDGKHFYTADVTGGTVTVVDTETRTVSASIEVGGQPSSVAVSPDGTTLYVTQLETGTVRILHAGDR
ncbi:protein kinase [Geodermatophilus sp. SYSU D00691]